MKLEDGEMEISKLRIYAYCVYRFDKELTDEQVDVLYKCWEWLNENVYYEDLDLITFINNIEDDTIEKGKTLDELIEDWRL